MDLFINGVKVDAYYDGNASNLVYSDGNACVGRWDKRDIYPEDYFNGKIDDILLFDYPLSESEIDSLYHLGGWVGDQTEEPELIAYYPFNGNANDESGNQNHGEVIGATLTADRFGNGNSAYYFDGVDDYIDCGNDTSMKVQFPLTMMAWVYHEDSLGAGFFTNNYADNRYYGVTLYIRDNGEFGIAYGNGGEIEPDGRRSKVSYETIDVCKWQHLTGVIYNEMEMDLFINGVKVDAYYDGNASNLVYSNGSACVGRWDKRDIYPEDYFNGKIDDIGIWSNALNVEQIDSLFHIGDWQNRFQISSIIDVPEDQGAWVYLNWYASPLDTGKITQYGIWEENPEGEWISLGDVPAIQEEYYTYLAHTFHDLSIDGINWSKFKVTAHTIDPSIFYTSEIDSGNSIDNIIPNIPEGLIASITEGTDVVLSWDQSIDEDFNFFRIYRSQEPGFDPVDPELVEEIVNNTCKDTKVEPGQTYYYKVSAIDIHGNESQLSEMVEIVIPQVSIDESLELPSEFSLFQNYPNPFNPSTTLRYDLPRESTVQLSIYNLNGYLVQTLINSKQNAGRYSVVWDALNQPSGVYLYKIQAGDFREIRKCLLVK